MITLLARNTQRVAWCLVALFYLDCVAWPLMVRAEKPASYFPTHKRAGSWLAAVQKYAAASKVAEPEINTGAKNTSVKTAHVALTVAGQQPDEPFTTGPGQPEMSAFTSVNSANMVDLFTGDFSYNIPLLDVGGYPVNIAYRGGVSMDQEASWVGLGWNINPGTISRNMRGLPDDFNGSDSVRKTTSIKENKTIGVTGGANIEIAGFKQKDKNGLDSAVYKGITVGASLGVVHNNYRGWGIEHGINASINSGTGAKGPLSGGLSIINSSQDGLTITPSFTTKLTAIESENNAWATGSFTVSSPYNSRTGIRGLQLSAGLRQYINDKENQRSYTVGAQSFSSLISFATPSFTPTITIPFTSTQFSFSGQVGLEKKTYHPSFFVNGYVSKQRIADNDKVLILPAYGYLYYQNGALNREALLDFNREKEISYREKPPVPHIAIPVYTYDAFSITGEGTGGMFRAYRGDIGFIYDHAIRTKDNSDRASVDVGIGDIVHAGIDININRAFTQNGPWLNQNPLRQVIDFRKSTPGFESVYFRNPGEKSINSKAFYEAIGGDDVVTVGLYQSDNSSSIIQTTNSLTRYRNKRKIGSSPLTALNAVKPERDKRSQVISYLTAKEADAAALSKYIESYAVNTFKTALCADANMDNVDGAGTGLAAQYFPTKNFTGTPILRTDTTINFPFGLGAPAGTGFHHNEFSIRWMGRVKAPATGRYAFIATSDDGIRVWLNDSLIVDEWYVRPPTTNTVYVNLVAGQIYKIRVDYFENAERATVKLEWTHPGEVSPKVIPKAFLYPPAIDTFPVYNNTVKYLVKEKRINRFRKENHISEVTVLNTDGRRYVYGLPVYNLKQKEVTFSANGKNRGNLITGLVGFDSTIDNTTGNQLGKENYFNSEEVPAYAHSFLLTGIVSADYSDVTGNGISDDDIGDAVKFNYSKVCGIANPFKWRAPYSDSATFNEGLKTDERDDKGNYVYGEKELWYLHSIESKTMVATFVLESRHDLFQVTEGGHKNDTTAAKRLKEIRLYSKADFARKDTSARPIKTVHFEYGYDLCAGINGTSDGKLTLKKIWFTYNGNNKGKQNPYVFNYNTKNPSYNIKSYDRWGNYKDPLQNPGSVTGNIITNAEYPYALQDSITAAQNAAAWSLDSIHLPSGGSIKVTYESDDYAYVQNRQAMQLFNIAGLGNSNSIPSERDKLYRLRVVDSLQDNLYVFIKVPKPVSNSEQVYQYYLTGITKLFFRLFVKMPYDQFGSGYEYVSCYADLSTGNYGMLNSTTIWVKLDGISKQGDGPGKYSPLTKAATQFLRLNLPSKAYPGSENGDNLDFGEAVEALAALGDNIKYAFRSFESRARAEGWCSQIDTTRSFVRLTNPYHKKYGGGQRVKRITIYDNWKKMTSNTHREAIYGQEYTYTTVKEINGVKTTISSGVASYEPGLGGEENPFHEPIEYVEKISPLGPVTLGYTEEPLGESFFPSAGVGYSCVRVRTINYKNKKSANGYEETKFYTAYDFPVYTDRTMLDNDTKKRYKPTLSNLLRVNAKHYISLSQGFKIELNDMHGKLRSKATYPETDSSNFISYSENIYRVENPNLEFKRLSNTVMVMKPDGSIDTAALIGKDVELMVDMREQQSITNGDNVEVNAEVFSFLPPPPGFMIIPTFYYMGQREENLYRSVATVKIIQRYGILDSAIQIDKGSKISTKDMLYDSETGDVLLTRTQNEFNDYVYNFSYPSHWAYDGMGLAYKNIDTRLDHVNIISGKIVNSIGVADTVLFTSGDEVLVAGRQRIDKVDCPDTFATFPLYAKIWAVDSSVLNGGPKSIYFIDRDGKPYSGNDVSLKITRSGRRNIFAGIGSVTSLDTPIRRNEEGNYELVLNTSSKIIAAGAAEFKQFWKVEEIKKNLKDTTCVTTGNPDSANSCSCLRGLFNYLIDSQRLFIQQVNNITVAQLVEDAQAAGYPVSITSCNILQTNAEKLFYALTSNPVATLYRAKIGDCFVSMKATNDTTVNFNALQTSTASCASGGKVHYDYVVDDPAPPEGCYNYTIEGKYSLTQNWFVRFTNCDNETITYDGDFSEVFCPNCVGGEGVVIPVGPVNCARPSSFILINADTTRVSMVPCDPGGGSTSMPRLTKSNVTMLGAGILTSAVNPRVTFYDVLLGIDSCTSCTEIATSSCYSIVTDTAFNPYRVGVLGNWRSNRSYTYYLSRTETDPTTQTDIRRYGTFSDFTTFWNFEDEKLLQQPDTNRWVWNSEMTLFNRKGFEIENKDPLGRYNAGLYGYNLTLPTAVIQNSRNRESAFEGFEDYDFATQFCDTACAILRHNDFSSYKPFIDTSERHSGKSSMRIDPEGQVAVQFALTDSATNVQVPELDFAFNNSACSPDGKVLKDIRTDNTILLPSFSPSPGKKMVLSAWVKEDLDCHCISYTHNRIRVQFTGPSPSELAFTPTGAIIEGWQRYESVFTIPADATGLIVSMEATTDSVTAFFDDLRIHPFNANMKSFVFHPVNLRLMAELDENNYATFYEYDDDGTLIRLKKETQRGVKTIRETRSALVKEQ